MRPCAVCRRAWTSRRRIIARKGWCARWRWRRRREGKGTKRDAAKTADASKRRFSLTSAKAVQAKEEHAEQLGANLDKLLQRREKADAKKAQRDFDDAWAVFAAEAEAAEAAKTEASEFGRA